MRSNSIDFGLKVVPCRYFGAKVYTIWVHGPLGLYNSSRICPKNPVLSSKAPTLECNGLRILVERSSQPQLLNRYVYATDASGGKCTRDARLRNVGWAVVAAQRGPKRMECVGKS